MKQFHGVDKTEIGDFSRLGQAARETELLRVLLRARRRDDERAAADERREELVLDDRPEVRRLQQRHGRRVDAEVVAPRALTPNSCKTSNGKAQNLNY